MEERNEIIGLLEEVEASLEELGDAFISDLQLKVAEARERLTKEGMGFVYCLEDELLFDWGEKIREEFKTYKLFILTVEIEIMATNKCDAQMNAKEMVDEYSDHRARLSQILKVVEWGK